MIVFIDFDTKEEIETWSGNETTPRQGELVFLKKTEKYHGVVGVYHNPDNLIKLLVK